VTQHQGPVSDNTEPKAPIAANALGVGIAELDTGIVVACVFETHADKPDTVIRVARTKRQMDSIIAGLQQCRAKLPD
jgi:hypothetical protein